LLDVGDFESSVSRCYYAMFYAAKAVLMTRDLAFTSHKGLISAFGEHFVKTGLLPRDLGHDLNQAFRKRQVSDYEYSIEMARDDAESFLTTGRRFVKSISVYLRRTGNLK